MEIPHAKKPKVEPSISSNNLEIVDKDNFEDASVIFSLDSEGCKLEFSIETDESRQEVFMMFDPEDLLTDDFDQSIIVNFAFILDAILTSANDVGRTFETKGLEFYIHVCANGSNDSGVDIHYVSSEGYAMGPIIKWKLNKQTSVKITWIFETIVKTLIRQKNNCLKTNKGITSTYKKIMQSIEDYWEKH